MPVADLPGVRLHYRVDGPADGPPVVLSNSLGTDLDLWDPQVPALLAAGLRIVRYDQRGHGRSSTPPGPYSLAELGGDVLGLLDVLGLARVSVAGVSLGGMTAQWLGAHAPDRVERIFLCCTSAHMPPASLWADRIAAVEAGGMAAVTDGVLARWFTPGFDAANPTGLDAVRTMLLTTDPAGYAACCAAIAAMDLRPDLPAVTAPTLVLAGELDPSTPPPHGRLIADTIPGARFVLVPAASHLANVERPDLVTAALVTHLTEEI